MCDSTSVLPSLLL